MNTLVCTSRQGQLMETITLHGKEDRAQDTKPAATAARPAITLLLPASATMRTTTRVFHNEEAV